MISPGPTITAPAAVASETTQPIRVRRLWENMAWIGVAILIVGACLNLRELLPWTDRWPKAWVLPFKDWISAFFDWLGYEADLGFMKFRDLTRGLAWLLEWPLHAAEALFFSGLPALNSGPLPWLSIVGLIAILGHYIAGWRLALVSGGCFFYLALFGVWQPAMETFAIVIVTAPFAVLAGLSLGIWAARRRTAEKILTPLFDLMQSTPAFAYLVPVIVLFGFGQVPAMIATLIFATPPMARCVLLGLRSVPANIIEAGRMAGCTPRQLLWKVQIPSARQTIMVGVNQAIMQTLAMVVIA